MVTELPPEKLRKTADPKLLRCDATDKVKPLEEVVGQDRAVRALKFGLEIKDKGFNIYAAGVPGSGRTTESFY